MKNSFVVNLKRFFSSRYTSAFIIILALGGRIAQLFIFSDISSDRSQQILATKNLLAGHGISTYEVFANNLSDPQYLPLIKWPPGYSLLLSPFYSICGEDLLWGSLLPDILAAVCFVFLLRKMIARFDVPVWLINCYTIVIGFFVYAFCTVNSSDLVAIVFFLAGLLFTFNILDPQRKRSGDFFFLVLFLFLAGFMRYMYIPVALIIPSYLMLTGITTTNKRLLRNGILILLPLILLFVGLLLYNKSYGGSSTYLYEVQRGFYPGNLFHMAPFMYTGIVNLEPASLLVSKIAGIKFTSIAIGAILFHLVTLLLAGIISLKWMLAKKFRPFSLYDHLVFLLIYLTVAVIALLAYLSATNAPIAMGDHLKWTYLAETRYYALPVCLLQLWLFVAIHKYYASLRKNVKWLMLTLLSTLTMTTVHYIYFTMKNVMDGGLNLSYKKMDKGMQVLQTRLHNFVLEHPGKNIVFCSFDYELYSYAGLWESTPSLHDMRKLNTMEMNAGKETFLFVAVKNSDSLELSGFLNNPHKHYIGQANDWNYYSINVGTDTQ